MKLLSLLWLLILVFTCGCPNEKYTIHMTSEKATVSRRIIVERLDDRGTDDTQREPEPLSAEELTRIARSYGEKTVTLYRSPKLTRGCPEMPTQLGFKL